MLRQHRHQVQGGSGSWPHNPYFHCFVWECKVDTAGKPVCEKHYSMGRQSWELAYVVPDRETVYGTKLPKSDLSKGELFCARFKQEAPLMPKEGEDAGPTLNFIASVHWVSMGKAKSEDIKEAITNLNGTKVGVTFKDLFKVGKISVGRMQYLDEGYVMTRAGGRGVECLKLTHKEFAIVASRLEKRRYAACVGCTTLSSESGRHHLRSHRSCHVHCHLGGVNGMEVGSSH